MADETPGKSTTPRRKAPRKKTGSPPPPTAPAEPERTSQEIAELERLRARLVTKYTGRR